MKNKVKVIVVAVIALSCYLVYQARSTYSSNEIVVVSREDGSGTRSAFVEMLGIEDEYGDDDITVEANVQNSENAVMTTVASVPNAIGYASVSSLDDRVKPVSVNGIKADVEHLQSGEYEIAREFNLAWKKGNDNELLKDFVAYTLSSEGTSVIESLGYVPATTSTESYVSKGTKGNLIIVGSTSVTPVVEELAQEYRKLNPDAELSVISNGSTTGLQSCINGSGDLGMASRELTEEELEELDHEVIALDGLAVILNPKNSTEDLTMDEIRDIFLGDITKW